MTPAQLKRASSRIGLLPKKERNKPIGLVKSFLFNLIGLRDRSHMELSPRSREAYVRTYGEEPTPEAIIIDMYRGEAERVERKIWDAQAKAGCKIRGDELVARDADREGRSDVARRLRKKAIIR